MVSKPAENPYVDDPDLSFAPLDTLSAPEAEREAAQLREAIGYHDYRYYVESDPVIADAAYDTLFDRLVSLEEAFDLDTEQSPTRRVGGAPVDELETVEHVTPMLSLDSSADAAEVREFATRITDAVGEVEYSAEPKFDGVSVEVVYADGALDRAVTRGDGERGDDITHNARTIRSLPFSLPGAPALLALRGEIYMPRPAFQALNERLVTSGDEPFANPRNAAAGTVRQLDPSVAADRPLDIYVYDVLETTASLDSQHAAFDLLTSLGLPVSGDIEFVDDIDEFIDYREEMLAKRDELPVETDGVVTKVNDFAVRAELGSTARHPRWAFAYKFPPKGGETTVRRIVIQVGRTGKLTPVALLDPVDVGGVTISRATLHNESIARDLGVVEGAMVTVERAGDVIPEVNEVIDAPEGSFSMPASCPVCGGDVVEEGEYHFCTAGTTCPAQLRRGLQHFGSKRALDIDGLGDKISRALVDEGLVESLADLYDLTEEDLVQLDRFAEQSAANLVDAIEGSKRTTLDRFLYALGIRHVGRERARQLAREFTLEGLRSASMDDLRACEDIGPEVAASIHAFFSNENNLETIDRLLAAGIEFEEREAGGEFDGLTFVFTGAVEGYSRAELADLLERHGARVTSAVSGETDYLVVGADPGSTKLEDARANDVAVIDADEFERRFLATVQPER